MYIDYEPSCLTMHPPPPPPEVPRTLTYITVLRTLSFGILINRQPNVLKHFYKEIYRTIMKMN